MKFSKSRENLKLPSIFVALTIAMFFLIYFPSQNILFNGIKSVLSLLFIFFIPGYVLTYLLFQNRKGMAELLILSIGSSVCITILMGMTIDFVHMKINFFNIMFSVLSVSLILNVLLFLKEIIAPTEKKIFKFSRNDKIFFFCIFLLLFVVIIIIYLSITLPSKEQFVELYWKVSELKDITNKTDVNCSMINCSLSVIYRVGTIDLANKSYGGMITDPRKKGMYDSVCIDFNQNGIFCEKNEGPFKIGDSFMINSSSFNIMNSKNDQIFIADYPKETNVSNFTVGFVIKSDYYEIKNFTMGLFLNDTLQNSEIVTVEPNQAITNHYVIHLPENGLYRIRIAVLPLTMKENTYIEFWVKKFSV